MTGGCQIRENDLFARLENGNGSNVLFWQGKSNVIYGSAELKYDYKDVFDLALKATYYKWDWDEVNFLEGNEERMLLALKPEMEFNVQVGYKPIQGLRVNVGYEYVKRCEDIYDPISNLYVGADYTLMKNLGVFAKVNNLLNKEYVRADAYPVQKLSFLAGVSLQF